MIHLKVHSACIIHFSIQSVVLKQLFPPQLDAFFEQDQTFSFILSLTHKTEVLKDHCPFCHRSLCSATFTSSINLMAAQLRIQLDSLRIVFLFSYKGGPTLKGSCFIVRETFIFSQFHFSLFQSSTKSHTASWTRSITEDPTL